MSDKLRSLTVGEIRAKAREDASSTLDVYWGSGVPINPVQVARNMGLSVFLADLGEDVLGMIVGSEGGADIYLDQDQPTNRMRFTCAHEIGHYVDRESELAADEAFVDRRSDDDRGKTDEVFANEFAGSLLVPRAHLLQMINTGMNDFELADKFKVSLESLRYRRRLLKI